MSRIVLILFLVVIVASCQKGEEYPAEPVISFKSVQVFKSSTGIDDSAEVVISFTDGDGDIGYRSDGFNEPIFEDTLSPYYRNFQLEMYEKIGSSWVRYDTSELGGRIPYLTPEGNNKALKGEIKMIVYLPFYRTNRVIYYEIFIYDRALHKSNTVKSPEIIINT